MRHSKPEWKEEGAIYLASYVMWRLNWIHPFADGNGRTSRVLAYLILSIRLNILLPGSPPIPDLIDRDKRPYYDALESADDLWKRHEAISIATMEKYLETLITKQLESAVKQAGV